MNHWKKFGMKTIAGVLTAGMLLGQPAVLYASGSSVLSEASEIPESSSVIDDTQDGSDAGDHTGEEEGGDSSEGGDTSEEGGSSEGGSSEGGGSSEKGDSSEGGDSQEGDSSGDSSQGGDSASGEEDTSKEDGASEETGDGLEGSGSEIQETTDQEEADNPEEEADEETEEEETEEEEEEETEEESEEGKLQLKVPAGKSFYIGQLSSVYHMSFSDDFGDVMAEIESENRKANGFESDSLFVSELTASEDLTEAQAPNWNDILAVYVLERTREGESSFAFNRENKEAIAAVYAAMNPVQNIAGELSYINFTIEDYKTQNEDALTEDELKLLEKYMCMDCRLMTAAATGVRALILGTMDETVSEDRANIVAAAYSLVGKISYFYGGYSTAIGWDDRWGDIQTVSTEGTESYGTRRAYGLDCSGYVMWSFINGFGTASAMSKITRSSQSQWGASRVLDSDEQVLPGDLVFIAVPGTVDTNHVGLVIGVKENGDIIVSHCNSYHNGVTIQEASSAGFKYVRRPKCLADGDAAVAKALAEKDAQTEEQVKTAKVTLLSERDNVPEESDEALSLASNIQESLSSASEDTEEAPLLNNIMQD